MKQLIKLVKHPQLDHLEFTPEDLRWTTPLIVADYRAKRLKCKIIADIGCGIGFQAFSLAKTCKKVYAIDIDKEKIKHARNNANTLRLKNITFICGDALNSEVVKTVSDAQIIFCDPQRPPTEQTRSLENIFPNVKKLLKLYQPITSKIAIEFPPQITEIPFDCEKEYLSVNGALNRLTLYFNELKQAPRSAVILPTGQRLYSETKKLVLKTSSKLLSYLYEVDPTVVKAKLLAELSFKTKTNLFSQEKIVLFTSEKLVKSPFFKNSFKILQQVPFQEKKIIQALQEEEAGKVIIRYTIDPENYWRERNKLESGLRGTKPVHLFKFGDKGVITEKN